MNERYIVSIMDGSGFFWGAGAAIDEAKKNFRKAGGKMKGATVHKFTSALPFAPPERKANADEADCWGAADLCIHWERCEREIIVAPRK